MGNSRKEDNMSNKKDTKEIVCLNQELISFDVEDISIEVLERRLEMAPFICGTFGCASFGTCGEFGCGSFSVGAPTAPKPVQPGSVA